MVNYSIEWVGPFQEDRASQYNGLLRDLGGEWLGELLPALNALRLELSASVDPSGLCADLAGFTLAYYAELISTGYLATLVPTTAWTRATSPQLDVQGLVDASTLASRGFFELASTFERSSGSARDYRSEVVVASLLEVAASRTVFSVLPSKLPELRTYRRAAALTPRRIQGRRYAYIVGAGDDLYDVAEGLYGDRSRFREVIAAFKLQPPYTSTAERGGCLSPGMRLFLPVSEQLATEEEALGETLALDRTPSGNHQEWDLIAAPGGGLLPARGRDGLFTELALRLITPLGQFGDLPRYGMPKIAGLPLSEKTVVNILLATDTLLDDGRVASVSPRLRRNRVPPEGFVLMDLVVLPKVATNV